MTLERDALVEEAIVRVEGMMAERRRQFCAQPLSRGVSMVQLFILMTLHESGPWTISEIAGMLQVAAPSASAIVDRMEEHELVRRSRSETDRRVVHVEIAEAGREAVGAIMGVRLEAMRGIFTSMTDAEIEAVVGGLRAVGDALARSQVSEPEVDAEAAEHSRLLTMTSG